MNSLTTSHSLHDLAPTGDPEKDARAKKRIEDELARLQGNKQRRRKKGPQASMDAGSPLAGAGSPGADGDATTPAATQLNTKGQPTQRKCANCGQVGHIKTNKKLCPLLNGTMQPDSGPMDSAAFMGAPPSLA